MRLQKKITPTEKSLDDRVGAFFDKLGREIKFALFSTKRESPEVRIELPILLTYSRHLCSFGKSWPESVQEK